MKTYIKKLSRKEIRAERAGQILLYVHVHSDKFHTRKELCEALGYAKSPTVIKDIEYLVSQKLLSKSVQYLPNGLNVFKYFITFSGMEYANEVFYNHD